MAPEWQVVHVPVVTSVLYNFKCSEISYGRGRKDWILTLIWAGRGKKLITIIRLLYSELSNWSLNKRYCFNSSYMCRNIGLLHECW